MIRGPIAAAWSLALAMGCMAPDPVPMPEEGKLRRDSDPGPRVPGPCDPLESHPGQLELDPPIVVGRASDGTVYAVDYVGGSRSRSFVGRDGTVHRREDGKPSSADRRFVYETYRVDDRLLILRLTRKALKQRRVRGSDIAMTLWDGTGAGSDAERMLLGESLEMLPPKRIEGWTAIDAPRGIAAEYLAHTPDDRWALVTMAGQSSRASPVHVFVGPRHRVVEAHGVRFMRTRDGTTHIAFELAGVEAHAHFPVHCDDSESDSEPSAIGTRPDCNGALWIGKERAVLKQVPWDERRARTSELQVVCDPDPSVER